MAEQRTRQHPKYKEHHAFAGKHVKNNPAAQANLYGNQYFDDSFCFGKGHSFATRFRRLLCITPVCSSKNKQSHQYNGPDAHPELLPVYCPAQIIHTVKYRVQKPNKSDNGRNHKFVMLLRVSVIEAAKKSFHVACQKQMQHGIIKQQYKGAHNSYDQVPGEHNRQNGNMVYCQVQNGISQQCPGRFFHCQRRTGSHCLAHKKTQQQIQQIRQKIHQKTIQIYGCKPPAFRYRHAHIHIQLFALIHIGKALYCCDYGHHGNEYGHASIQSDGSCENLPQINICLSVIRHIHLFRAEHQGR